MRIKVNKYAGPMTRFQKPSQLAVKAELKAIGEKQYADAVKRTELRRKMRGQKPKRLFGDPLAAYRQRRR